MKHLTEAEMVTCATVVTTLPNVVRKGKGKTQKPNSELFVDLGVESILSTPNQPYDALGNLRRKQVGDQLIEVHINWRNQAGRVRENGGAWKDYLYNSFGAVTDNGDVAFTRDYNDQPTAMVGTGPGDTPYAGNFTYDGNLKRVKQVVSTGGESKTIYSFYGLSGGVLFRDEVTEGKKTSYLPNGIRLVNGAPDYTHADHLGSPVAMSDASGTVLWREHYTPFGEKLINPAANKDNTGYTGHIDDAASGLTYMQARYYDPKIGRFLSNDPVGFAQGGPAYFNRYAYVYNDPINLWDPDGKKVKVIGTRAEKRAIRRSLKKIAKCGCEAAQKLKKLRKSNNVHTIRFGSRYEGARNTPTDRQASVNGDGTGSETVIQPGNEETGEIPAFDSEGNEIGSFSRESQIVHELISHGGDADQGIKDRSPSDPSDPYSPSNEEVKAVRAANEYRSAVGEEERSEF